MDGISRKALETLVGAACERTFTAPRDAVGLVIVNGADGYRAAADVMSRFDRNVRFVRTAVSADLAAAFAPAAPFRRLHLRDVSRVTDAHIRERFHGVMATRMTIIDAADREAVRLVSESILTPPDTLYVRLVSDGRLPTHTPHENRIALRPEAILEAFRAGGDHRPADVLPAS